MKPPSSRAGPQELTRAARSPKTRDHTRSFLTPHGDRLRIRIYSDLHLEFAPFLPPANDADVIVLAGDIGNGAAGIEWARENFQGPRIYLAGNHQDYEGGFEAVQAALGAAAPPASGELAHCS